MREDIRKAAVYSTIVLLTLCFTCRVHGQTIELVSLVVNTNLAAEYHYYSGCGITSEEEDELEDYMSSTIPVSELIKRSGRQFHLGTYVDTNPSLYSAVPSIYTGARSCYWKPDGTGEGDDGELDWDCSEGSSQDDCYCKDDPLCDPRQVEGEANTECNDLLVEIPFLDAQFDKYRQILERDFPYYNVENQMHLPVVNRKMGVFTFDLADEVLKNMPESEPKGTGQALIYALPPWMVHMKTTPQELANALLDEIDAITSYYFGEVDRWIVVNEAVRSDAPPAVLLSGISATQQCMHVSNSAAGCLGNSFPWTPAIEGEDDAIPVYALLDDEIVKIVGRIINGQGECLGECDGECDGLPATRTTFFIERAQCSTSAGSHDANCIIYTLKSLIQQERMGTPPDDSGFWCPEPEGETPEIVRHRYWLWHTLTDAEHNRAGDISDVFLVEAFKHARYGDSNAKLFYNGDDGPFFPGETLVNQQFLNTKAFLKLLKASGAPIDGYGAETHVTTWWFLIEDEANGNEDGIRLCPRNIQGFIDRLKVFCEIVDWVALTELDVRMGIPTMYDPKNPEKLTSEYESQIRHTSHWNGSVPVIPTRWETAGTTGVEGEGEQHERNEQRRQIWQGRVYKAILNAALSVPNLYSVTLWTILDEYSWFNHHSEAEWPYTPKAFYYGHCNINGPTGYMSSNPCILGARWDETSRQMVGNFYLKPAYYGVREAIENYFGTAFVVKDTEGTELIRFAKNGNVIILKGLIYPYSNVSSVSGAKVFAVKNSTCNDVAVVTANGDLHLAGTVSENQDGQEDFNEEAAGVGLVIKNDAGALQSMIDKDGNLKARGEVIAKGVPYTLDRQHGSETEGNLDPYFWK